MFARSVSIRLKPNSVAEFNQANRNTKLFRCFENKKVSRTKLRSSLPTERTLSQLACGIRNRTRTLIAVMPIQDCSRVLGRLLRELLRFTPMRLPVQPSTKSRLTLRPEVDRSFGGRTIFAPCRAMPSIRNSRLPSVPSFNRALGGWLAIRQFGGVLKGREAKCPTARSSVTTATHEILNGSPESVSDKCSHAH